MKKHAYSWRIILVAVSMTACFGVLATRLTLLHLGTNQELRNRITQARYSEKQTLLGRGRIVDRNGAILGLDLPVKDVFADPKKIVENGHLRFTTAQLSRVLELNPAELMPKLNKPERQFAYVKRFVRQDVAKQLGEMQMPGVHFINTTAREYPHASSMSHVIGFSNWEGVGSAGIEQRFNTYLSGLPGLRITERDGRRREVYNRRSVEIPPQIGADVHLTLDLNIQFMVEEAVEKAMEEHSAKGVWVMVQRIRTGEILAIGSRPHYNPNEFRSSTLEQRRNRAISYTYEPGSTFKVAVIAAALNEKLISPKNVLNCEHGTWYFRGRPLRDFHPYGNLTVEDVLKKSSNIGAAKIALMLGNKRLENYIRKFGFGRFTGIELPGEEAGIFYSRKSWSALSASRIAMGHEVAVTSLQMLNAVCAIANKGFLMKPYVVRKIVNAKGDVIKETEPHVLGRPISLETAATMRRMMERVSEKGGTGRKARVDGYRVCVKTGTAQKPTEGGYSDDANIASIVGFLPAESPEIGIIVVVDEPQPLHTGGSVCGPVFKEIASEAIRYLGIPPDGEQYDVADTK